MSGAFSCPGGFPRTAVNPLRIRAANRERVSSVHTEGNYVLYWMIANRRTTWNYSLQRAIEWARHLSKPLVIFEALRCRYPWASDRFHHFVIQGMANNHVALADKSVTYYPYLEPGPGAAKGLIETLAAQACMVVTDDFPCFFLPQMVTRVGRKIDVPLEVVDSNGILPLRAANRVFSRAFDFRRYLQKHVKPFLIEAPKAYPMSRLQLPPAAIPKEIFKKWPAADVATLSDHPKRLSEFPINHSVSVAETSGGSVAAGSTLKRFLNDRLEHYLERNQPEQENSSGLSPYLHFGHISTHQVFHEAVKRERWTVFDTAEGASGSSTGWWGTSAPLESFLDELITWREIGYNMCSRRKDYARFSSLPDWAKTTLAEHAGDPREHLYLLEEFEQARTHDPLWNAAQTQLVREGRMHNYLRMLWGKKILEWTPDPQEALAVMIELNNKYALDGRNPNSYSGIFWVLGRYDRAWGPERKIFGKIRYMSSVNTARKLKVRQYIQAYALE